MKTTLSLARSPRPPFHPVGRDRKHVQDHVRHAPRHDGPHVRRLEIPRHERRPQRHVEVHHPHVREKERERRPCDRVRIAEDEGHRWSRQKWSRERDRRTERVERAGVGAASGGHLRRVSECAREEREEHGVEHCGRHEAERRGLVRCGVPPHLGRRPEGLQHQAVQVGIHLDHQSRRRQRQGGAEDGPPVRLAPPEAHRSEVGAVAYPHGGSARQRRPRDEQGGEYDGLWRPHEEQNACGHEHGGHELSPRHDAHLFDGYEHPVQLERPDEDV